MEKPNDSLPASKPVGWQKNLQRAILRYNPRQADDAPKFEFNWKQYRKRVRFWHVLFCSVLLFLMIWAVTNLWNFPFFSISFFSIYLKIVGFIVSSLTGYNESTVEIVAAYFGLFVLILLRRKISSVVGNPFFVIKNLPKLAMREEALFRYESEKWNLWDKVRSCFTFGLLHITMIIVPLGVCFLLAFGGGAFMGVYLLVRRTSQARYAVEEVATVHTTYNLLVLILTVGSLLLVFLGELILFFLHS